MKNLYLFWAVVLFIVCVAIFIENVSMWTQLYIFNSSKSFAWWFLILFIAIWWLWTLLTLYIQSIIKEKNLQEYTNFDL